MEKKIITEVNRIREMMGLSLLNEQVSTYAKKLLKSAGYTDEAIETLGKNVDLSDLTKLSDEFGSLGIKSMDDWESLVTKKGIDLTTATDEQILKLIDETPGLKSAIDSAFSAAVKEASDKLMKNLKLPEQAVAPIKSVLSREITSDTKELMVKLLKKQKDGLDNIIKTLNDQGKTVPDDLTDLRKLVDAKYNEALNFKSPDVTTPIVKTDIPTPNIKSNISDETVDELVRLADEGNLDAILAKLTPDEKELFELLNKNLTDKQKDEFIQQGEQKLCGLRENFSRNKKLLTENKFIKFCDSLKGASKKKDSMIGGTFQIWGVVILSLLGIYVVIEELLPRMSGEKSWIPSFKKDKSNQNNNDNNNELVKSWFNSRTGPNQDFEGATNPIVTPDQNSPGQYTLTYTFNNQQNTIIVKVVNGQVIPQ
jgi:hypothetical protein